jgi:formate hydrogenlyase subunit 3/multisubunit Na+/H+ antiporter MnhD subunit
MTAPLVWILIPALLAVVMFGLIRWQSLVTILGTICAFVLAITAWLLPVKEQFFLGPLTINFSDTWSVLGRRFVLGAADRPSLVILYLATAFFFGAAYIAHTNRFFVPVGLAMVSLLTAALAVEPFLYAALLIEMAVLVSVPLLTPPDSQVGKGILRYITLLSLGMPFILLAGWMMSGIETEVMNEPLLLRASFLIGLGFSLQLAIFPFHSWIPMLGKESHPYAAAFIFTMIPGAITLIVLGFLQQLPLFSAIPDVQLVLRVMGVTMVVFAGLWAAFQNNLGSMLGYAAILEIGFSLILLSLLAENFVSEGFGIFFAMLFPRGLGLGLWALALALLRTRTESLDIQDIEGAGRILPVTTGALVLAQFSLAGLPLLASFPIRLPIWGDLSQVSPAITIWTLVGCLGLIFGGMRTLAMLVIGSEEQVWKVSETRGEILFLVAGMMLIFIWGVFPQWILPSIVDLPFKFALVGP